MPPKLWCVRLLRPLKGSKRVKQELARSMGLEKPYEPVVMPNTQSNNDKLRDLEGLVYVHPLIISPTPYPYADRPMLTSNGVFYPSVKKCRAINLKYGNTSHLIQWPANTDPSIKIRYTVQLRSNIWK